MHRTSENPLKLNEEKKTRMNCVDLNVGDSHAFAFFFFSKVFNPKYNKVKHCKKSNGYSELRSRAQEALKLY